MWDSKAFILICVIWRYLIHIIMGDFIQDQVNPVKLKWICMIIFCTCWV